MGTYAREIHCGAVTLAAIGAAEPEPSAKRSEIKASSQGLTNIELASITVRGYSLADFASTKVSAHLLVFNISGPVKETVQCLKK